MAVLGTAPERTATDLWSVRAVERAQMDKERVANAVLETPQPGSEGSSYGIDFAGWAIGLHSPVRSVQVIHDRQVIAELPAGIHRADVARDHPELPLAAESGFAGSINALRMDRAYRLTLNLVLEDGSTSGFMRVEGSRGRLRSPHEPHFNPLLVTTLGRTGSTWLMHLLGSHPELLAYRPFRHEPRAATYWLDLMLALSEPAASYAQLDSHVDFRGPWWLGQGNGRGPELSDPALRGWMKRDHVEGLAAFAQERIDATYGQVASVQGRRRRSVRYFVEKFLPENTIPQLALELYPEGREIILVRDFRDMLASMHSYDVKRGAAGFGRDGAGSDEHYVRKVLGTSVLMLLDAWRRRCGRAILVRYEDLILEPRETLGMLLERLGLDASPARVESVLEQASRRTPEMSAHQTTAGPRQSIGRWRRDLDPDLQRACEEAFGPALEEFGYT